jgi:hypothetical protein
VVAVQAPDVLRVLAGAARKSAAARAAKTAGKSTIPVPSSVKMPRSEQVW